MIALRAALEKARRELRPLVMGILNVTPDSFSDGGLFTEPRAVRARIEALLAGGADLIDIGGESTRPGSAPVSASDQLARVIEPIRFAAAAGAIVSIDTTLPRVAEAAIEAGAQIVNDVSCLEDDELAAVAARGSASLIIMHSRGSMAKMTGFSQYSDDGYSDVVAEVGAALLSARARAETRGLPRSSVLLDPGLGFHKNAAQSYALLGALGDLVRMDAPVVVGASRKSFLARDVPGDPSARLGGTIAASLMAARRGAVVLRVHDVQAMRQALAVERAVEGGRGPRA